MAKHSLIDIAKAPNIAYGKKDWEAVRASVTPGVLYDEIATHRKIKGVDQFRAVLQGWAKGFPNSEAIHHNAIASGTTVVLELTWHGTHTGPPEALRRKQRQWAAKRELWIFTHGSHSLIGRSSEFTAARMGSSSPS